MNNHTNQLDNHHPNQATNQKREKPTLNPLERLFIWLSGSDRDLLRNDCPKWEKVKYEAFGASVLVPVCFGSIAASYAVSTLTDNWYIIIGFALVWGFIILAIDRVLLSTYRAYASKQKKALQFFLRITVAILMGLTISHPLTLLLFQDTVASEIEKKRGLEIVSIRETADQDIAGIDQRILKVSTELNNEQQRLQDIISGKFLEQQTAEVETASDAPQTEVSEQNNDKLTANIATPESIASSLDSPLEQQIVEYKKERDQLRGDLEKWQQTYDEEVRGIRSGVAGVGPNAQAIERDHLSWRKQEINRLNEVLVELEAKRTKLTNKQLDQKAETETLLLAKRQKLELQKIDTFANFQEPLVEMIKNRIETGNQQIASLRDEIQSINLATSERIKEVRKEPREDLMSQTLALHDLFTKPHEGGTFALMVYVVLALLFAMIDTIPLVVKFFAEPGPYDMLVHYRDHCLLPLGKEQDFDFLSRMKFRADMCHELLNYEPEPMDVEELQLSFFSAQQTNQD